MESSGAAGAEQRSAFGATVAWGLVLCGVAIAVFATGDLVGRTREQRSARGLTMAGRDIGGLAPVELAARAASIANELLDARVTLVLGDGARAREVTRRQLGVRIDTAGLIAEARGFGRRRSGLARIADVVDRLSARLGGVDLEPTFFVDRAVARDVLVDLKDEIDRAAVDAHLDLDHHVVAKEQPGCLLKVYDALVQIEYLARAGRNGPRELSLGTSSVPARVTAEKLAEVDISTVLGAWETHYSSTGVDSDRTYNLKVGADHLNGHILMPGELFSFNDVVGDRTEKEGYRVAPVIAGGELVDGLAGGMCQIASTLHAAAFFGGLEIVSSTPHSRPSAYITMGLDSTVVYPTTDLKLKNPYDFPIVMHYNVNQGSVKVELLGKARPNHVVFEREIKTETGFGTEGRRDPTMPEGQRMVLQEGYPGYGLVRRRFVFAGEPPKLNAKETVDDALARLHVKPLQRREWALHYPSTSQIVAIGTGPKSLKKKEQRPAHHIPPLRAEDRLLFRIVR